MKDAVKKHEKKFVLFRIKKEIFAFLPILFVLITINTASATRIYVDPSNITDYDLTPSKNFSVDIGVEDVNDLYGWQVKLYFDSTIIKCTDVIYPSGHVFEGKSYIPATIIDNVTGYVKSGAVLLTGSTFSGNGTLSRFNFIVSGTGISELNFSRPYSEDTYFLDSNLDIIPDVQLEDGYFRNGETTTTTTTSTTTTSITISTTTTSSQTTTTVSATTTTATVTTTSTTEEPSTTTTTTATSSTTTTLPGSVLFNVTAFTNTTTEGGYVSNISYNNNLGENALVVFLYAESETGKVVSWPAPIAPQGSGKTGSVFYCHPVSTYTGSYTVSWRIYNQSDSRLTSIKKFSDEYITIVC